MFGFECSLLKVDVTLTELPKRISESLNWKASTVDDFNMFQFIHTTKQGQREVTISSLSEDAY